MAGALDGVKIVELVGLGPAPFAGMMLADHGAQVIRVHPLKVKRDLPAINTHADVLARSRPQISVDLKSPDGQALILDLVAQADGLIEGFRPGVAERLGVGPEPCLARNPKLAYGRMTGWGQTGPMAHQAGHDLNYISMTGALAAIGPAEAPVPPINFVGDFGGGGMMMAFGMLAAIVHARAGGPGQVVDAAMVDGASLLTSMIHGMRAAGGWTDQRADNLFDGGAYFYGTYECADGGFMAVAALEPQFHALFLDGIGIDPAEVDQADKAAWPRVRERVGAIFKSQPRRHWEAVFEGSDACVTPVLTWEEAQHAPENTERALFAAPQGIAQPAPAPRFARSAAREPHMNTQTAEEVLTEWGISPQRINSLQHGDVLRDVTLG